MPPFWGPSVKERSHLIETLETLGPTSLLGLSAALSWSPRRTEKVVVEVIQREEADLIYDRATQTISFPAQPQVANPAPATTPGTASAPPVSASVSGAYSAPPMTSSSRTLRSLGQIVECPACRVGLETTGTGDSLYCPKCGRLTSAASVRAYGPSTGDENSLSIPTPPGAAAPGTVATNSTPRADRRAQELFAAWVTASPIPCPKCRTPLKHRSFAQYTCPKCGQSVTFAPSESSPLVARTGANS